jgi:hypothetical protein
MKLKLNQNPLRQGLFLLEFEIGFYRLISKKKRNMIINEVLSGTDCSVAE